MPTMLKSRLVADQVDDDMIRRLIHGIEDFAECYRVRDCSVAETLESVIDGDHFLAYQDVRALFVSAYPDLYGGET